MKIAFIGLGNMGGPMAANLIKAGFEVQVFDLLSENVKRLTEQGATSAETAADAVENAQVVVSMLPAGRHVRSLYLDDESMQGALKPGTLVIDSSTIDAQTARVVAKELTARNIDFIDAPVSGGVAGAQAATLTFIVGGEATQFEKAQPVLSAMGKNIFHAGKHGAGQVAKICNNMLLAVLMAGTSEALRMGINNGLDAKVLSEIMQQSSGANWTLDKYNPCPGVMENVPSSKGYQGGFLVDLMKKDLGLALDTAIQSNSSTPMGSLAQSLYSLHSLKGHGSLDFSSIFTLFEHVEKDS
ncbi:3-hydroxyisobutyrate dehydrogenase [Lacimicrobium alkaliphilum]|uniref:3-hydroxyisobutyrate dehydrogenase n=2 Tax=Lacimicrobium alkaliphilum TaxID=1526571 RepID=A0ABQ1R1Z5_9ALTE|nr:3-hydroxyisobutyrate dehydrogenase [Lacimicrobium alkaliphilum]